MEKAAPSPMQHAVAGLRLSVIAARFNATIVDGLLQGCLQCLWAEGLQQQQVQVLRVPGVFELPQAAHRLARIAPPDAIIALGAVIRGETLHHELISTECIRGLATVGLEVPMALGVLTVENVRQAEARAAPGPNNRGHQAALAALEMAALCRQLGAP